MNATALSDLQDLAARVAFAKDWPAFLEAARAFQQALKAADVPINGAKP
jgi:hypothetical protein